MSNTNYDLIVYGASSFVGNIMTRYLVEHLANLPHITWAIAGRSAAKLEQLRSRLGAPAAALPIIVANANDNAALHKLCSSTRVVVSSVGPYALYGEPLVAACAETGTDYCDITGEAYWIRRMIDTYQVRAEASGARLVSCCGFDSIPSDLGVHFLQGRSMAQFGHYCNTISLRVASMRGGASGGTIASVIEAIKAAKNDRRLRREMLDPYQLCPAIGVDRIPQTRLQGPVYDEAFNAWVAPFIMEAINSRVVLRSSAIGERDYGSVFAYHEGVLTGTGLRGRMAAIGMSAGLGAMLAGLYFNPLRALLTRWVLPAPGEGPSPEAQLRGSFDIRLCGADETGNQLRVQVTGDRDPGYGSTAKMLAQSALCLLETPREKTAGGFWTPATAMGDALIERLQQHAGITFDTDHGDAR
ncbi:MAG: saccharopine dehydrogenase NADP-binding domain-containing protein [Porticoccaceae bacterium]|nr:saccharopine dehydrogenase NADP-binding domain-containing protein [Porticoccaceae bacterium]